MRVLVTGALGKVGRQVVAELGERHELVLFDRSVPSTPGPHRAVRGDATDLGQVYGVMAGCEAVVHLAAIAGPAHDPPEVVFRTNVMGTFNVAEAAAVLGVRRVVYASSGSALGFAYMHRPLVPEYMPIDEAHPLQPQEPYALSKKLGEEIMATLQRRTGISTICIRPPTVIAPEEYAERVPRALDNPRRSLFAYVDVRDLAVGIRLALESDLAGHETFFVAADDALAREPLATLFPRFHPGTERAAAPLTGPQSPLSSAKAKRLLGYQPQHSWRDHVPAEARP